MPGPNDRSAPIFNEQKPRELRRYFQELRRLLQLSGITDHMEMKQAAIRYLPMETAELWEELESFSDANATFDSFVTAVFVLYPGAGQEKKFAVADLNNLIDRELNWGILTSGDMAEYNRRFFTISAYLIRQNRMSDMECRRAFLRGIQPELRTKVLTKLEACFPYQAPDEPFAISDVVEAAMVVLYGTGMDPSPRTGPPPSLTGGSPSAPGANGYVKTEDFANILEAFTHTMAAAVSAAGAAGSRGGMQTTSTGPALPRNPSSGCNFCGSSGHFIRECPVVQDYIRAGKVKRNAEGKVVLPSGSFVPRDLTSDAAPMKDRFDEWHRRNPNQLATGTASGDSLMMSVMAVEKDPASIPPTGKLMASDRIAGLERELAALRSAFANKVYIGKPPPFQKADRIKNTSTSKDQGQTTDKVDASNSKATTSVENTDPSPPPIHPFAKAKDAAYQPPNVANVAAGPRPPNAKKPDPNYTVNAPVWNKNLAEDVFDRAMSTEVRVTQRELLSLSPEVRLKVREVVSPRRQVPPPPVPTVEANLAAIEEVTEAVDDMPVNFAYALQGQRIPPPGATVLEDPYEAYLKTLKPGDPDELVVAAESFALKAIYPIVDNQMHVEAILDPGCQVIAMSDRIADDLGLIRDPTVIMTMQ
ncbi:hypothetical protein BV25DRAFT_1771618, partial [Artomyces pyxidatus]